MEAYNQYLATMYDSFVARFMDGDVPFYVDQARRADGPVLDLACGTGRVTFALAEAGIPVIGLDTSPAMLASARQKLATLPVTIQQRVSFLEANMRTFALGQRVPLVIIPCRAFLHLVTPNDQQQALQCIREHLAAHGRLILNIFDPRIEDIAAHLEPLGTSFTQVARFPHPAHDHQIILWSSTQYHPGRQFVEQLYRFEEVDRTGTQVLVTDNLLTFCYIHSSDAAIPSKHSMAALIAAPSSTGVSKFGSPAHVRPGSVVLRQRPAHML
jgi:SAM-dependent methyltransferase